jgi:hypothetical protein
MRSLIISMLVLLPAVGSPAADNLFEGEHPPYLGKIEVGSPFPGLWLPAADDGHPMSVSQLRGKRLVLHVFASW